MSLVLWTSQLFWYDIRCFPFWYHINESYSEFWLGRIWCLCDVDLINFSMSKGPGSLQCIGQDLGITNNGNPQPLFLFWNSRDEFYVVDWPGFYNLHLPFHLYWETAVAPKPPKSTNTPTRPPCFNTVNTVLYLDQSIRQSEMI